MPAQDDFVELIDSQMSLVGYLHARGGLSPLAATMDPLGKVHAEAFTAEDSEQQVSVDEVVEHFRAKFKSAIEARTIRAAAIFFHGYLDKRGETHVARRAGDATALVARLYHADTIEPAEAVIPYTVGDKDESGVSAVRYEEPVFRSRVPSERATVFLRRTAPRDGETTALEVDGESIDLFREVVRTLRRYGPAVTRPLAATMDASGAVDMIFPPERSSRGGIVADLNYLLIEIRRQVELRLVTCGAVFCYAWIAPDQSASRYTDQPQDASVLMAWLMKDGVPLVEIRMSRAAENTADDWPFDDPTGEVAATLPIVSGQHMRYEFPAPEPPSAGILCSGVTDGTADLIHRDAFVERWDLTAGRGGAVTLPGHELTAAAVSGDLARYLLGSADGTVVRLDAATHEQVRREPEGHAVSACALDAPGIRALVCCSNGVMMFWNVESGFVHRNDTKARVCALSGDGTRALTDSTDGSPLLWEWREPQMPELLYRLHADQSAIVAVALSADGSAALTSSEDGKTFVWDFVRGRARFSMNGPAPVRACAMTRDGQFALTAHDGVTVLWDAVAGTPLQQIAVSGRHTSLAFTPDGTCALAGLEDGSATFLELFPS